MQARQTNPKYGMRFFEIVPLHDTAPLNEAIDPAEGPSRYWFVLAKNGLARCINENDSDLFDLRDKGWDVIWDSAKSVEEGLERAYKQYGYLPWDDMEPLPVASPTVFYRSVSLPELKDILKTGAITGKGSSFNETETRRWVFFGDKISKNLIWQGEDHQRYAQMSLDGHAIHEKHRQLAVALKMAREDFVEEAKKFLADFNRRNAGRGEIKIDDADYAAVLRGSHAATVKVAELTRFSPSIVALRKELRDLEAKERELQQKFRGLISAKYSQLRTKIEGQIYSSAIIETKPLTGGLHYSDAHGKSYFGSSEDGLLDEYTFPPGTVTLADITRIHWVKDRKIVSTSDVKAAPGILRKMNAKPVAAD
jgi:hypothetical protein